MMSGVSAFLWQAALMLLVAYFLGVFIGYWLRRRFNKPPKVAMEAGMEADVRSRTGSAAPVVAATAAAAAPTPVAVEDNAGAMGDAAARTAAKPEPAKQAESPPAAASPSAAESPAETANVQSAESEPKRFTPPMSAAAAAAAALAAHQAAAQSANQAASPTASQSTGAPSAEPAGTAEAAAPTTPAAVAEPSPPAQSTPNLPSATGSTGQAVVAAQVAHEETPTATIPDAPAEPDDLLMIAGVSSADAQALRDAGFATFAAIAAWSAADVSKMNNIIGNRRISRENWIEQAQLLQAGTGTIFSQSPRPTLASRPEARPVAAPVVAPAPAEPVVAPAPAAPAAPVVAAVSDQKPDVSERAAFSRERRGYADDLQQIDGINAEVEKLLNEQGVTRIAQIAGWPAKEQQRIDRLLGGMKRVDREDWVGQARRISGFAEAAPTPENITPDVDAHIEESTPDAGPPDVAANAATPATVSPSPEAELVDLAQTAEAENETNTSPASEDDISEAPEPSEPTGNVSLFGSTPTQASPVRGLRSVRSEALVGANTVDNDGVTDDLKHIRGIGVLIEKRLRAMGYTSYAQIGSWTRSDIDRVNQQLDFRGRIERENWIEQARILAAGGQTDFSRRQERGEN